MTSRFVLSVFITIVRTWRNKDEYSDSNINNQCIESHKKVD